VLGARDGKWEVVGMVLGSSVGESVGGKVASSVGESVGPNGGQMPHVFGHVSANPLAALEHWTLVISAQVFGVIL